MAGNEHFEDPIAWWLEERAPARIPGRVLDATFERTRRTRQDSAWRTVPGRLQMPRFVPALGGAAVVVAAALVAFNVLPLIGPAAPTTSPSSPSPTATNAAGSMWPQSTLEEVRAAQERADAGDPDYTWQLDSQLFEDGERRLAEPGRIGIVDRFLREVLGWDAYMLNGYEGMGRDGIDDVFSDQRWLRCEPGTANPLYPSEPCAPTLDDGRYESVSIDLAQPDRQDTDGVWVVNGWRLTAPFAQADPVAVEAQATEALENFLAARIAGEGAEGRVTVDNGAEVPLLYGASTGASYERYEIELVEGPEWPYGSTRFAARLFADGNATVVEQVIRWMPENELLLIVNSTTENGQPVVASSTSADGEVSVAAPNTWTVWWPEAAHLADVGVWFGTLWHHDDIFGEGERIELVDPVAYDAWCAENDGSPLLSGPASAEEIAQVVIADSNFETTEPVRTTIGGLEAVSIDVALRPGGAACPVGRIEISRWIHTLERGEKLRLYLVDLPEGLSVETLAITVVASKERFEAVIAETAPIIESIEFHAP